MTGGISKVGDAMVRTALYEAANVMLTRAARFSTLKRWALEVAKRRGMRRAKVALARKLAPSCTACGSTAASSASARRCGRRVSGIEESEFGAGWPVVLLRRGPVAGTREPVKPVSSAVAASPGRTTRPRLARRLPSDGMVWRPACRPRTEARTRRQDDHSRGLTPDGPLRKHYSCGLDREGLVCRFDWRDAMADDDRFESKLEGWARRCWRPRRGCGRGFSRSGGALGGRFPRWAARARAAQDRLDAR